MTTKTKQELLNEIEDLKKEVELVERYKSYAEVAREIKIMQDAFVEAGFTEEQAFDLIKTSIAANVGDAVRKMR